MRIRQSAGVADRAAHSDPVAPPFSGTIFIDPDIITASDPTTFLTLTSNGQGTRTMFDRRADWIVVQAYLFDARFSDGLVAEVQVNPEFGGTQAARASGEVRHCDRPPAEGAPCVSRDVWIHQGVFPFGDGNNNLLIHVGQGERYLADGILEETFVHEAAHTSLDAAHAFALGWVDAQKKDGTFISAYARDFPQREDIAESFLPYLAVRFRPERITQDLANTILRTIPNRVAYFDAQVFLMLPVE